MRRAGIALALLVGLSGCGAVDAEKRYLRDGTLPGGWKAPEDQDRYTGGAVLAALIAGAALVRLMHKARNKPVNR